jgi:hypothetical protein
MPQRSPNCWRGFSTRTIEPFLQSCILANSAYLALYCLCLTSLGLFDYVAGRLRR